MGGTGKIEEEIDALWVIGPQQTLSQRALYQLDQIPDERWFVGCFYHQYKSQYATTVTSKFIPRRRDLTGALRSEDQ